MLSQSYRLPATTRLVHATFRKTPLFSVKIAKNDVDVSRFAFLVRKTVDKRAVKRNRIRRVFRSCIENNLETIVTGYDMLFFLEKGIMEKSYEEVWQKIQLLLKEEHLIK